MDRSRLQQMGLTAFNVGQNVLVSLAGSFQTAPAFWLNPQNGVVYQIAMQTPQYRVESLDALLNIPVGSGAARRPRQRHDAAPRQPRRSEAGARSPPSSRATTSRRRSTST